MSRMLSCSFPTSLEVFPPCGCKVASSSPACSPRTGSLWMNQDKRQEGRSALVNTRKSETPPRSGAGKGKEYRCIHRRHSQAPSLSPTTASRIDTETSHRIFKSHAVARCREDRFGLQPSYITSCVTALHCSYG